MNKVDADNFFPSCPPNVKYVVLPDVSSLYTTGTLPSFLILTLLGTGYLINIGARGGGHIVPPLLYSGVMKVRGFCFGTKAHL